MMCWGGWLLSLSLGCQAAAGSGATGRGRLGDCSACTALLCCPSPTTGFKQPSVSPELLHCWWKGLQVMACLWIAVQPTVVEKQLPSIVGPGKCLWSRVTIV